MDTIGNRYRNGDSIKVLIVDDSAVVRRLLGSILSSDNNIEVVGAAPDPFAARDKILKLKPDVLTLDIEMPKMDGITFLEKLMQHYPLPVVICSSLTLKGCETAIKAMELGAVEVLHKPALDVKKNLNELSIQLIDKVKAAAKMSFKKPSPVSTTSKDTDTPSILYNPLPNTMNRIIAVGASTGGTKAIRYLLSQMPVNCPGIVIVQHMPEMFTKSFAMHLDATSKIDVKEAQHNDVVRSGLALVAPGNHHMLVKRKGSGYYVETQVGPLVNRHRPSVEVLFKSVAKSAGPNSIGIIMTGMGDDGAEGLLAMRNAGAHTLAQDEHTSVVFGMPKEAIRLGAVEKTVPLNRISATALKILNDN